MAFVSLCCDRNMNDTISIGKNVWKHSATLHVSTRHFFPVEMFYLLNTCFYINIYYIFIG